MPCLVQTEALFDEDRSLSLQEWASIWKIQRLCLATQRPYLVKQIWCIVFNENTKTEFYMFQTFICLSKHLFLSLTGWQNQFYLDLLDQWGLFLANMNICLKHVQVCHFMTDICLIKPTLCFTKQGICLYQTKQNRASNKASVYVYISLYGVMSQPLGIRPTITILWFFKPGSGQLLITLWFFNRGLANY